MLQRDVTTLVHYPHYTSARRCCCGPSFPVSTSHLHTLLITRQSSKYKMLSYRRETALQGALQFSPKVEDWNWETIFYGH